MKLILDLKVRAAMIAANFAQQLGLPLGNLWEPAVAKTLADELQTESESEVVDRWRVQLGLPQ